MSCEAELCVHWAGAGCVCSVLDLTPEHGSYCQCGDCIEGDHDPCAVCVHDSNDHDAREFGGGCGVCGDCPGWAP